VIAAFVDDFQI